MVAFTKEHIDYMLDNHDKMARHELVKELSKIGGEVNSGTLAYWLDKFGLKSVRSYQYKIPDEIRREIAIRLKGGERNIDLANEYGISIASIHLIKVEYGIGRRKSKSTK